MNNEPGLSPLELRHLLEWEGFTLALDAQGYYHTYASVGGRDYRFREYTLRELADTLTRAQARPSPWPSFPVALKQFPRLGERRSIMSIPQQHALPHTSVFLMEWEGFRIEVDSYGMFSCAANIAGAGYRLWAYTLGELTESLLRQHAEPLPWRAHA